MGKQFRSVPRTPPTGLGWAVEVRPRSVTVVPRSRRGHRAEWLLGHSEPRWESRAEAQAQRGGGFNHPHFVGSPASVL